MKKLMFIIILLLSTYSWGQNSVKKKSITVTGKVQYQPKIFNYRCRVNLMLAPDYEQDSSRVKTVKELKAAYFKKLKNNGFDPQQLEEDRFGYLANGFRNDGTLLLYQSKDKTKITQLLGVQMEQTQNAYGEAKIGVGEDQYDSLSQKALEDARVKAKILAKNVDGTLGEIIALKNISYPRYWVTEFYHKRELTVEVTFAFDK